jgi:hypothetical protein
MRVEGGRAALLVTLAFVAAALVSGAWFGSMRSGAPPLSSTGSKT